MFLYMSTSKLLYHQIHKQIYTIPLNGIIFDLINHGYLNPLDMNQDFMVYKIGVTTQLC